MQGAIADKAVPAPTRKRGKAPILASAEQFPEALRALAFINLSLNH